MEFAQIILDRSSGQDDTSLRPQNLEHLVALVVGRLETMALIANDEADRRRAVRKIGAAETLSDGKGTNTRLAHITLRNFS